MSLEEYWDCTPWHCPIKEAVPQLIVDDGGDEQQRPKDTNWKTEVTGQVKFESHEEQCTKTY